METLGRLAALEALLEGVIAGQIHAAEAWPVPEYVTYNRRMMYAGLSFGVEQYSPIVDCPALSSSSEPTIFAKRRGRRGMGWWTAFSTEGASRRRHSRSPPPPPTPRAAGVCD